MVAAIIAALGGIVSGVGQIVGSNNARKISYQEWLASATPTYTDVFGNYRSDLGKNNLIIIGVMAGLIVVLVVAIMLKNDTK